MAWNMKIDKKSKTPVYRQIIEQIVLMIRDNKLSTGDKLLPERELADMLGIARGTVKKAYEKLANNSVIEITQGKGSYVTVRQDVVPLDRKEQAIRLIENLLVELEKLKFDYREIRSLFHILLMEHEQQKEWVNIAGIDCNPEALSIFDQQLRHIANVQLHRFLLTDLYRSKDFADELAEFDLILTTSTHYDEVIELIPKLKKSVVQVVVSLGQQTIIDLAKIPSDSVIGCISLSENFFKIIKQKIDEFQLKPKAVTHLLEDSYEQFPEFIRNVDVLITPPKCMMEERRDLQVYFQQFRENGGRIIRFDHQIERGALIHIEERIAAIIKRRKSYPASTGNQQQP